MFTIHFKGFFQCRLATDSDDFDEPRGSVGWTFAYDGEPDLDRIIRFQNPSAYREFAPKVGVTIVDVNGSVAHRLVGARVDLKENAKFEGRNGLIAPAGKEPIAPFAFEIAKDGFQLNRRDDYVVTDGTSRKPHLGGGVTQLSAAEQTAIGVQNPAGYRNARRAAIEAALASETDPVKKANYQARIAQLKDFNTAGDIQVFALGFKVPYAHKLRHAGAITDPAALLPHVDFAVPWDIQYWMGAWDADALQGYVEGTLSVASS